MPKTPRKGDLGKSVAAVEAWLSGGDRPPRTVVAAAVRATVDALAAAEPGGTVEVRVPPYAAVQCVAGPRHTRGTPPNVVETDPRTWLELATGRITWGTAVAEGRLTASGTRADVSHLLPLMQP